MHPKTLIHLLCFLFLGFAGCKKVARTKPVTSADEPSSNRPSDVCALLTEKEIQELQGSPIKETKGSARASGGLRMSQCFYTAQEFSRSVSLEVTESDSASSAKRSAKEFWEQTFGRFEGPEKEHEGDKEKKESLQEQRRKGEEEEGAAPRKISGVGDEAYWTASRVGGALYVLKKDAFIRISLGGKDDEETRLEKSKKLAEKALARF